MNRIENPILLPDQGWKLKVREKITRCSKCGEELKFGQVYYCMATDTGYCYNCEKKILRTCNSVENQHEHFNIIVQEVEDGQ